jgi:hypothetical protein
MLDSTGDAVADEAKTIADEAENAALLPPEDKRSAVMKDLACLRIARNPDASPDERLTACWSLMELGNYLSATRGLIGVPPSDLRRSLLNICARMTEGERFLKGRSPWSCDAAVAPGTGKSDMFVVFAGAGHRFVVNWLMFARPDVHVVVLRDHSFGGYVSGLRGVGSTFGECLKWLDWVRGDVGAPRVHMLGLSMGGYGALRWGLETGAITVSSFSSPTNIILDEVHPDDRIHVRFYRRVFSHAEAEAKDCRRLYDAAASRPRTRIFFGEQHARDSRWARNMTGVQNCTLEPVSGINDHHTFGHLTTQGSLPGLLNAILSEGT